MTTYEIISVAIALLGLVIVIFKVWSKTQTDIAMINIEIANMKKDNAKQDKDFADHKADNDKRFSQMHVDNREDFKKVFARLDFIVDKIGEVRK